MGWAARIAFVINLAKATWAILGWFGLTASVAGIGVAIWGGVKAVALGIPWPIAMMAGFCVLTATAYLVVLPMAFRLVRGAMPPPFVDHSAWYGHTEYRLSDAACLFAGVATIGRIDPEHPAWAWYSALSDAIRNREIQTNVGDGRTKGGVPEPDFSDRIPVDQLRAFANARDVRPRFLFLD